MDRRRFVKSASLGAAGLWLSSVASRGQADLARPESPVIHQTAWGRVWIRWTEPTLPAEALLAQGLVIPWGAAPALVERARKQGYRVYAAATPGQAAEAASSSHARGFSGILLEAGDAEREKAEKTARQLRLEHPDLTVLFPDAGAKQPAMMGTTVITDHGMLQVSSPTEQPWLDSNLAMVGYDRAFRPAQTPLIDFQWTLADALQQQLGPSTDNYLLAVAEAGALHSDLILNLHPNFQRALLRGSDEGWTAWKRIAQYVEFYLGEGQRSVALQASVGVITNNYDDSYETMNLMARHNIPFRVLPPGRLTSESLQDLDLVVVFAQPDEEATRQLAGFVKHGGVAILVSLRNPFPGLSSSVSQAQKMGRGKVIALADGVGDPGAFSRDVRRLLGEEHLPVSLWNASTTIVIPYILPGASTATVELLNYSADPMPVQVRIQGTYSVLRYETPERGCCESVTATHQEGFTQFEVPPLKIGGRVHLGRMANPQKIRV
ncbi:MAG TPA: hypothetical protein VGG42_12550 [Acidobacteriaceae bacterium]